MDAQSTLLWSLIFGSIGLGFFIYGRRQDRLTPKYCGLTLMVFPYFVADVYWLVGIGIVLMAVPYILRE